MGRGRGRGRAKHPALHIPQMGTGLTRCEQRRDLFCSLCHLRALSFEKQKEKHTGDSLQPELIQNQSVCAASNCAFCPF